MLGMGVRTRRVVRRTAGALPSCPDRLADRTDRTDRTDRRLDRSDRPGSPSRRSSGRRPAPPRDRSEGPRRRRWPRDPPGRRRRRSSRRRTALGLVDLGGRVPQGRADLIDVHLDDGALLALLGLVGARLQPARHDDPGPAVQTLGDVLRRLAPDRAAHEEGLPVLPLVALPIERAWRAGHGEVRDGRPRGGEAQLRVSGEVADHGEGGFTSHVGSFPLAVWNRGSLGASIRRRRAGAWCA